MKYGSLVESGGFSDIEKDAFKNLKKNGNSLCRMGGLFRDVQAEAAI